MSEELKPEYLLVKRGLYYRPDNHGYTGLKREAGRYFQSDAYEGVLAVHEDEADEYAPSCWPETQLADKDAQLSALAAQNALMVEKLEWYADQLCEGWCDKDPAACAAIGPENCAGCPARNALSRVVK